MPKPPLARLLVVDDNPQLLDVEREMLEAEAYEVCVATSAEEALPLVEERFFDLLILDEQMTGMTGSQLLEKCRERHPDIGAIFLTGYADVDTAVQALRLGALDFLRKGHEPRDLVVAVRRALALTRTAREKRLYWYKVEKAIQPRHIIGRSAAIKKALALTKRAAPMSVPVLLQGETGTGKELFARAVHDWSRRKERPFVAFNCAAFSPALIDDALFGHQQGAFTDAKEARPGYFEAAHGGTMFLDEIGEMPLDVQPKLLRTLEVKKITRLGDTAEIPTDVRVIAATNRDLKAECDAGRFRQDLFFRLSKVTVLIPPLRSRGDDIALLAEHLCRRACRETGRKARLSPEAIAKLKSYSWPGNIRELDNVIFNALMTAGSDEIGAEAVSLPEQVASLSGASPQAPTGINDTDRDLAQKTFVSAALEFERNYFSQLLAAKHGNKTAAARAAGMERTVFYDHLRKAGLLESKTKATSEQAEE